MSITVERLEGAMLDMLRERNKRDRAKYPGDYVEYEVDEEYPSVDWDGVDDSFSWGDFSKEPVHFGGLVVSKVDAYGGSDLGSEYWMILRVEDPKTFETAYFKVDGYYYSFADEGPFSEPDVFEVKQAEKTVTYWSKV